MNQEQHSSRNLTYKEGEILAFEYGFFNSVNGDRLYNAENMNDLFEGLITSGVYQSIGDKMAVSPNTGMAIQIGTGRGFFDKHWVNNSSTMILTIDDSDLVLNRYDAIVIKVDKRDSARQVTAEVKKGEFASSAVRPTMTRGEFINEYCLAYVYVKAGATSITSKDIEDTRFDNSLCGWVTGLIEQLDTTTLYQQWQAVFNDWFANLQVELSGDVATKLTNALPESVSITIPSNGWTQSGSIYYHDASIVGMNTAKSVIVQPDDSTVSEFANCKVKATEQKANALRFTASTKPTTSIVVNVLHMG